MRDTVIIDNMQYHVWFDYHPPMRGSYHWGHIDDSAEIEIDLIHDDEGNKITVDQDTEMRIIDKLFDQLD